MIYFICGVVMFFTRSHKNLGIKIDSGAPPAREARAWTEPHS